MHGMSVDTDLLLLMILQKTDGIACVVNISVDL